MKTENDPANYRKLNEPFPSNADAEEAVAKFYEAVKELRKTHHIAEVLLVCSCNIVFSDGSEGQVLSRCSYGSMMNAPLLAAYALGETKGDIDDTIAKHLKPQRRVP